MTDKIYDEEKQKSIFLYNNNDLEEEILKYFSDCLDDLQDKRIKKIFKLRYKGENKLTPWRKISQEMNLSIQGCINIHNSALRKISKNLKNKYETIN